jgi:hypothetical protein
VPNQLGDHVLDQLLAVFRRAGARAQLGEDVGWGKSSCRPVTLHGRIHPAGSAGVGVLAGEPVGALGAGPVDRGAYQTEHRAMQGGREQPLVRWSSCVGLGAPPSPSTRQALVNTAPASAPPMMLHPRLSGR